MFRNSSDDQPWFRFGDIPFLYFLAVAAACAVALYQYDRLDTAEISVLTTIGMFGILGKRQGNAGRLARSFSPQRRLFGSFFRSADK